MSKRARITLTPATETGPEQEKKSPPSSKTAPRARQGVGAAKKQAAASTRPRKKTRSSPSPDKDAQTRAGFASAGKHSGWSTRPNQDAKSPPPPEQESQAQSGSTAAAQPAEPSAFAIGMPSLNTIIRVVGAGLAVVSLVMLWKNRRL